ncbi:aldose epimerase [Pseudoroseomonas cervicalis]|uniref:Aldose 1-epimerase n=1 Tax=Pseudoroseomonas cervicalis ATCC 49957 TaxID=525371 RepID=D5RKU4_9PROT|nr:aldose 1-epimerase [Pseudoroseomonas cervicalis]EFH12079.1 aldose 1-epimerase [Pseudoroseomonas cervicalis ATCC 49957]
MSLRLAAAGWDAMLRPGQGAAFAALRWQGRDLLAPLPDGADPNTGMAGAFWMLPWTNRLEGGAFPWAGAVHAFPITHPAEGNALHGLARALPWQVEAATPGAATLAQQGDGGPFHWRARLGIALSAAGLRLSLALENAGDAPCPMGFGWHPWFARPEGCTVRFAATHRFPTDDRKLPLPPEPSPGLSGGEAEWLGLDAQFAGWDGVAELHRPDGCLTLRARGDWARNLQVYAPAHLPLLCLEPVSHVPAVINRPDLAPWGAMRVLAPGEGMAGEIEVDFKEIQ